MAAPSTSLKKSSANPAILQSWARAYSATGLASGEARESDNEPGATRSASDAQAALRKWHQGTDLVRFSGQRLPWYLALEQARVEVLAAIELPGVARNLKELPVDGLPMAPAIRNLYRSARSFWGLGFEDSSNEGEGSDEPRPHHKPSLINRIRGFIKPEFRVSVDLEKCLAEAGQHLGNEAEFARAVYPLVLELSGSAGPGEETLDSDKSDTIELSESEEEAEVGYGRDDQPAARSRVGNYSIFRTSWDECEPARVWHLPEDIEALRELNALDRRHIQKLAHDLQRHLLAQRLRHWDFELEDGMLDSRKLAALVGERPDHRVFKSECESRVPEACVTLLVDQSGSMRGTAHLLAAQAIDVAVHTLEVCGVAVEVLGYTTRYGVENPVLDEWRSVGSPSHPGRLNALRHVIFKSASQPWRVSRRYLGLLLRPDFGQENIDGESLHWAAHRLLARSEPRRILIVISDGSPYDEASVQNNESEILTDHLGEVIQAVESSPVQLLGIGTGREVGRFYRDAVTVRRGDMIGSVLFGALARSFDQSVM